MVEPVSEAILIEIMQRFRRLENLSESASKHVKATEDRLNGEISRWHKDYGSRDTVSNYAMRELASLEKRTEAAEELRQDLESAAEACRDDINRMQDEIRSRQRSMAA